MSFPTSGLVPARRILTATTVAAFVALAAIVAPIPVAADPIAEKKAEAERIAAALEDQAARVSMLTEELNAARVRSEQLAQQLVTAEAAVAATKQRVEAVTTRLKGQAVDAYVQGGGLRSVEVLVGDGNELIEFPVRLTYVRTATAASLETLDALREERARLGEEEARLAVARRDAEEALASVEERHVDARAAVERQRATLATVQGEVAELVAAEQQRRAAEEARRVQAEMEARRREEAAREAARREAAAREAARRETAPQPARSSARPTSSDAGAGAAGAGAAATGAAAAVEEARRQLGKPYEYGADGPDSFDCSGLTQWAWKAGGKYLPHSSRAQYSATSRVALPNIKLGDLLFFGPSVSGIHHVGIYAGDGKMIEASQTGTPVRYASIYRRDMVGIGRVN